MAETGKTVRVVSPTGEIIKTSPSEARRLVYGEKNSGWRVASTSDFVAAKERAEQQKKDETYEKAGASGAVAKAAFSGLNIADEFLLGAPTAIYGLAAGSKARKELEDIREFHARKSPILDVGSKAAGVIASMLAVPGGAAGKGASAAARAAEAGVLEELGGIARVEQAAANVAESRAAAISKAVTEGDAAIAKAAQPLEGTFVEAPALRPAPEEGSLVPPPAGLPAAPEPPQLGMGVRSGKTRLGVAPEAIDPFAQTLAPPESLVPPTAPTGAPTGRGVRGVSSELPELSADLLNRFSTQGIMSAPMGSFDKAIRLNRNLTEVDGVVGRMVDGKFRPGYWTARDMVQGAEGATKPGVKFIDGAVKTKTEVEAMAEVWAPYRDANIRARNAFIDDEAAMLKEWQGAAPGVGPGQFGAGAAEKIGTFGLGEEASAVQMRREQALRSFGAKLGAEGEELDVLAKRLSSHPAWDIPGAPGLQDAVATELGAIRGASDANREFALAKIAEDSAKAAVREGEIKAIIRATDPTAHGALSAAELEAKAARLESQAARVGAEAGQVAPRTALEAQTFRHSLASEAALSGAYSVARTVDESVIQDRPLTAQMLVGSFTIGGLLPIGIGLPGKALRSLPSVMPKGSLGSWAEKTGAHNAIRHLGGTPTMVEGIERHVKGGVTGMGKRVVSDVERETGKAFWRQTDEELLKFAKDKAKAAGEGIRDSLKRADKVAPGGIDKNKYIEAVFGEVLVPLDRAGGRPERRQIERWLGEQLKVSERYGGGLEQWHEMRQFLDGKIRWSKQNAGVLTDPLRKMRALLEESIEKKLADSKTIGDLGKEYAAHKATYTVYKRATDMLERKIATNVRNQAVSLGDRVVGAGLAGAVGGPHGLAAAVVGGMVNKYVREKASAVVASAFLKEETLSRLQKATLTVEKQMDRAASKWVTGTALASSGIAAPMSAGFFGEDPETRRKNFENWLNDVQVHAMDPAVRSSKMEKVLGPISDAAPEVAQHVSASVERGIQYLHQTLPIQQTQNLLMPMLRDSGLSDAEISRVERTVAAVNSPHSQVVDFMNGTLSKEGVDAWRAVYPAHYDKFVEKVTAHLFEHKTPLNPLQLENLATLYGQPIAGRLESSHIQTAQTLGAKPSQGNKPLPQSNGGINRLAGHYQPPSSGGGP